MRVLINITYCTIRTTINNEKACGRVVEPRCHRGSGAGTSRFLCFHYVIKDSLRADSRIHKREGQTETPMKTWRPMILCKTTWQVWNCKNIKHFFGYKIIRNWQEIN